MENEELKSLHQKDQKDQAAVCNRCMRTTRNVRLILWNSWLRIIKRNGVDPMDEMTASQHIGTEAHGTEIAAQ